MKRFTLVLVCCLLATGPVCATDSLDEATLARLENGEVVAREARADGQGGSARMLILVRAPARAVWDVVASCDQAFIFVDGLQECEVLDDRGASVRVHQVVRQSWFAPAMDFVFESSREPYERNAFHLVEGNLRSMQGEWRFRESDRGTVVDYEISLQPAMPVPRFLVRRSLRSSMPNLLACIRALAGGSLSPSGRTEDLGRCPGLPASRPESAQ
ncbi:MAG: SRPBCC family protein [Lysobacterales bacterium]|jgi:hypothetical protein